jgi:hypothetical protein
VTFVTSFVRSALWWLLPLIALAAILAYETDFGRALRKTPPAPEPIEPKPVATALLPEFAIPGGIAARRETVERTLFTPTRRPAPELAAEAAKARMQRGQFALTGTAIVEGKNTAFLRETNGGRSRRVTQGDTINGVVVADVKPDRVKLAMGDETEELVLRVTTNPRVTPQPAVAAAPPAVPSAQLPAQAAAMPPALPTEQQEAQTLAERRRAARAAQAAAQAAQNAAAQGTALPPPAAAQGGSTASAPIAPRPSAATVAPPQAPGPGWNEVFQRYQNRSR